MCRLLRQVRLTSGGGRRPVSGPCTGGDVGWGPGPRWQLQTPSPAPLRLRVGLTIRKPGRTTEDGVLAGSRTPGLRSRGVSRRSHERRRWGHRQRPGSGARTLGSRAMPRSGRAQDVHADVSWVLGFPLKSTTKITIVIQMMESSLLVEASGRLHRASAAAAPCAAVPRPPDSGPRTSARGPQRGGGSRQTHSLPRSRIPTEDALIFCRGAGTGGGPGLGSAIHPPGRSTRSFLAPGGRASR